MQIITLTVLREAMSLQLNFNQMYFFYMAALHGGVRNAARVLHVSPPAVSAQIKRLEDTVGFPLLLREGGKLTLSEQGNKIFPEVKKLFSQAERVEEHLKNLSHVQESHLVVGGHHLHLQCLIPPHLAHAEIFGRDYKVKLVGSLFPAILQKIMNNEIHVGIVEHVNKAEGLRFEKIFECNVVFAVCSQNTLGQDSPVSLRDLDDVHWFLPVQDSGFAVYLDDYFETWKFTPKICDTHTLPVNRSLLPSSKCATFFPEYYFDKEVDKSLFRKVDLVEALPPLQVFLAYSEKTQHLEKIQHVVEMLKH